MQAALDGGAQHLKGQKYKGKMNLQIQFEIICVTQLLLQTDRQPTETGRIKMTIHFFLNKSNDIRDK